MKSSAWVGLFVALLTSPASAAVSDAVAPGVAGSVFLFPLEGAQEVPPMEGPTRGACFAKIEASGVDLAITCTHNAIDPTLMRIHHAAAGSNGPVVFDIGLPASPASATWTGLTADEIADLLAGDLYVNLHTAGRPGGTIRGQVLQNEARTLAFSMDESQETPDQNEDDPPTGATGRCTVTLPLAADSLFVRCRHDVEDVTVSEVHIAPLGVDGPLVFGFDSAASPFEGTWPFASAVDAADLLRGYVYVNIHSAANPSGEIRGQIEPANSIFTDGFESGDTSAW